MSTDPNSLGEFLAGNTQQDPGVAAPEPVSQSPPETTDQKLGRLVNDNAQLRAEMEAMRLEMQAARAQAQPQPQQQQPADPQAQWYQWVRAVQSEAQVPEQLWMESPNEAFLRSSAAMGRKLWEGVQSEAEKHARRVAGDVATGIALDARFESRYPDLYRTEVGHIMVNRAVEELRVKPDFQQLLRNIRTVPQALERIASLAYEKLGSTPGAQPPGQVAPSGRKGTFGEPGGSRPMGQPSAGQDVQKNELQSMMEYAQGHIIPE